MRLRGGLDLALLAFVLAVGLIAVFAGYNRLARPQGRLLVEECRLERTAGRSGLFAMLAGQAPLRLPTVSRYDPIGEARPLAERLAAFGFSADPVRAARSPARQVHVAIDERDLSARDLDRDAEALAARYADVPGIAVARGIAEAMVTGEGVIFRLAPMVDGLHPSRADRRRLKALPLQEGEACRSRFMAVIVFGAGGDPYLAEIRPLERVVR